MTLKVNSAQFGRIAVMLGGESAEREVSLNSGNAVYNALHEAGCDVIKFDPATRRLTDLIEENVDRVFIMLHGRGGEDGSMQGALEQLKIPYTGSGVLGSALAMDKIHTKQIWQTLGLPTAKYKIAERGQFDDQTGLTILEELNHAIMVKPACEGSSIGMAKVSDLMGLKHALNEAFRYDHQVLLEQYITGAEYTVSVLNGEALPSIRMQTPHSFYDYAAKYEDSTTQYFCPSDLTAEQESELADLCVRAFKAVSAQGWGRVDVMQDQHGQFYLLEVNTVPGMTATSLVPKAAKVAGYSFTDLCFAVLATSL